MGLRFELLAATTGETIALVTAAIAAVAAAASTIIAAWQAVTLKHSERKRTQPIVVAYERSNPSRAGDDHVFRISIANEGVGPAFNIHFGISVGAFERAYEAHAAGAEGEGDVPRALGPSRALPPDRTKAYELLVPADALVEAQLPSRVYWCRYENAFGDNWQTRNPWEVNAELTIDQLRNA